MIREDGVPDTLRIGGVLTDMLATNLARVSGLSVLANSRLFELMRPGQDTLVAGYSDAARRAGATEILQGRLLAGPQWGLAMEIQRVDLASGIVKGAYRVAASDRYALIDSMTWPSRTTCGGFAQRSVADATSDSPIAYRLYEEGLRAYYLYDFAGARRLMQAALQEDSTFAMAAYYDALLVPDYTDTRPARERALRLAGRAPERERLRITADMLALEHGSAAVAVAESLTTRFPSDPRSFGPARTGALVPWRLARSGEAGERAIALDSASEPVERQDCRLCGLSYACRYLLLVGSLLAADEPRSDSRVSADGAWWWDMLVRGGAARRDTAGRDCITDGSEANPLGPPAPGYLLRQNVMLEDCGRVEQDVQPIAGIHARR
jgi:hypothetical protein